MNAEQKIQVLAEMGQLGRGAVTVGDVIYEVTAVVLVEGAVEIRATNARPTPATSGRLRLWSPEGRLAGEAKAKASRIAAGVGRGDVALIWTVELP